MQRGSDSVIRCAQRSGCLTKDARHGDAECSFQMSSGVRPSWTEDDSNPGQQGTGNAMEANGMSSGADISALQSSDEIVSLPGYIVAEVSVADEGGLSSPHPYCGRRLQSLESTGAPLKRMRRGPATETGSPESHHPSSAPGKTPKAGSLAKAVMFQTAAAHRAHTYPAAAQHISFGHLGGIEEEKESLDSKMQRQITNFRRMATKTASLDPNVGISSDRGLRRSKPGVVSVDLLIDEERMADLRKEYAWRRYPEPIEFGRLAMALIGSVFPVYGGKLPECSDRLCFRHARRCDAVRA